MRAALLCMGLLLLGCVGTEGLEESYCRNTHLATVCADDADCCPTTHRCLGVIGYEGARCVELGRCIGGVNKFPVGGTCSCNDDCASNNCTNQRCE